MPNITLTVPAEVLRAARIRAAERGTSVSGLVREYLVSLSGPEDEFARLKRRQQEALARIEATRTERFSAGDRLDRDELHDRAARRTDSV